MSWGNPSAEPAKTAPVAATELSAEEWLNKREALLIVWTKAQETLAAAKESEMTARTDVANFAFPVDTRLQGKTNNQDLPNGYVLKLADKLNYKITAEPKAIQAIEETVIPTIGNEAPFLFERIIKIKYDFSIGEYNKLDKDNPAHVKLKDEIDKLMEVSRGTPALEIKEPKPTL